MSNEGQKLELFSLKMLRWLMRSRPFLSLRMRPGPLALCILKVQRVTTKSVYRLLHAIYYCS